MQSNCSFQLTVCSQRNIGIKFPLQIQINVRGMADYKRDAFIRSKTKINTGGQTGALFMTQITGLGGEGKFKKMMLVN